MNATSPLPLALVSALLFGSAAAADASAAGKTPTIKLRFSGLLAGRSYTITLQKGAAFVGATRPESHVEKTASTLTFRVPEAPKGSDAPEIEEALVESEVEISAGTVTYEVELSGRTSVEIDLLGEVQVRGRPHQLNGVPFTFELKIPDLPKGWVLRPLPCPADPTGKARTAAVHGGYSACRPGEAK